MSKRQYILLVDDDPFITQALAVTLERPGRTTIICSDIESAEMCLTRYPVTDLISDVQFSGDFGFEGLHFLTRVRALAPGCRIVLMSGNVSEQLARTARDFGAAEVLSKPFDTEQLERALATATGVEADEDYASVRFPPMEELLESDELVTVFQPILKNSPDGVEQFGYEALTRVRGNWLSGGPATLFEYAERRAQLAELNLLAVRRAIETSTCLPGTPTLFINVDPLTFSKDSLLTTLKEASRRSGVSLSRVILEVTERSGFEDDDAVAAVFDELRALGLRFALDDHGSAYSHLNVISRIGPSFIKISQTFGTDFEQDATKMRIIRHVVALARDFGCQTILEGIESAESARVAATMGIDLMQGYYFGRPQKASSWTREELHQFVAA